MLRVGFLLSFGLGLFIAGLWIKRRWTKPRVLRLSIYIGFVCLRAVIWEWLFGHILVFEILFYENIAFQNGLWLPRRKVPSGIRNNLALQVVLIRSPFLGAKRDWLAEKYFQSHIMGESPPEVLTTRLGENHAAFCKIDGQMISERKQERICGGWHLQENNLPLLPGKQV